MGRRNGDRCGTDDRGSGAVRAPAEPPGRPDAAEADSDGDEPSGAEGGSPKKACTGASTAINSEG